MATKGLLVLGIIIVILAWGVRYSEINNTITVHCMTSQYTMVLHNIWYFVCLYNYFDTPLQGHDATANSETFVENLASRSEGLT